MDGTFYETTSYSQSFSIRKRSFVKLERHNIYFVAASGSSFPRLQRESKDYTRQDGIYFRKNGSVIHLGKQIILNLSY